MSIGSRSGSCAGSWRRSMHEPTLMSAGAAAGSTDCWTSGMPSWSGPWCASSRRSVGRPKLRPPTPTSANAARSMSSLLVRDPGRSWSSKSNPNSPRSRRHFDAWMRRSGSGQGSQPSGRAGWLEPHPGCSSCPRPEVPATGSLEARPCSMPYSRCEGSRYGHGSGNRSASARGSGYCGSVTPVVVSELREVPTACECRVGGRIGRGRACPRPRLGIQPASADPKPGDPLHTTPAVAISQDRSGVRDKWRARAPQGADQAAGPSAAGRGQVAGTSAAWRGRSGGHQRGLKSCGTEPLRAHDPLSRPRVCGCRRRSSRGRP